MSSKINKRILVFHPAVAPYRIDFFNAISDTFEARICLFQTNLQSQIFDTSIIEEQLMFRPIFLLKRWKFGNRSIVKGLVKQIIDFKPDIVIVPEVGATTLIAIVYKLITSKGFKIVSIVDDSYDMAVLGKQFSRQHKWGEKLIFPYLDDIICVEERVADHFQTKYGKGIHFPIICKEGRLRNLYKESLPYSKFYVEKYGLTNKHILLFVGRLTQSKNLLSAIHAFELANIKDAVFVIVGEGELKKEIEKVIDGSKNIILPGRYEHLQLFGWYNIASCLILPSTIEPFGAVTNESLLAGCYSLISKLAGSQCLIEEGKNGMLIDPYDVNSMAKIIRKALLTRPKLTEIKLRDSLMQETFDVAISRVIHALTNRI